MEQWLAIFGFALVTSITPGPNNMMVTVSGANFGVARSVPHILGICVGFPLMVMAVGLGLGGLLEAYPLLHRALTYVAFAYLVYLAWKLARSGRVDASGVKVGKPVGFLSAALFQWVNPKAWIMAVSATALYVAPSEPPLAAVSRIALLFVIAGLPAMFTWCLFGTAIARTLHSDRRVAFFNGAMAVLLVASMVPTLL